MVKEICELKNSVFPNVTDCDLYVAAFHKCLSIKEQILEEQFYIEHANKYTKAYDYYILSIDKHCNAWASNEYCVKYEFDDMQDSNSLTIVGGQEGTFAYVSDNLDELKQFINNLFEYEHKREIYKKTNQ